MPGIDRLYLKDVMRRIAAGDLPLSLTGDLVAARGGDEEAYGRLRDGVTNYEAPPSGSARPPAETSPRPIRLFRPSSVSRGELEGHVAKIAGIASPPTDPDSVPRWIADYVLRHDRPQSFEQAKRAAAIAADVYRAMLDIFFYRGLPRGTMTAHRLIRQAMDEQGPPSKDFAAGLLPVLQSFRADFDLQDAIAPLVQIPEDDYDLRMRSAAYVVFRLQSRTRREALISVDGINDLYAGLRSYFFSLDISDTAIVQEFSARVFLYGLSAESPWKFSAGRLAAIGDAIIGEDLAKLEARSPAQRKAMEITIGPRKVNGEEYYRMLKQAELMSVAAIVPPAKKDGHSGGSEGGAGSGGTSFPGGAAGGLPGATARPYFTGVVEAGKRVEAGVREADEAGAAFPDEGAWIFAMPNAETPPPAAFPFIQPLVR